MGRLTIEALVFGADPVHDLDPGILKWNLYYCGTGGNCKNFASNSTTTLLMGFEMPLQTCALKSALLIYLVLLIRNASAYLWLKSFCQPGTFSAGFRVSHIAASTMKCIRTITSAKLYHTASLVFLQLNGRSKILVLLTILFTA